MPAIVDVVFCCNGEAPLTEEQQQELMSGIAPTKISGEDTPGTVAYLRKRQHEPLWTVCLPGSETELVCEATVSQTVFERLQIWVDQKSHQKIVKQDSQMQSKIYQVPTSLYPNSDHHVKKVQQCVGILPLDACELIHMTVSLSGMYIYMRAV